MTDKVDDAEMCRRQASVIEQMDEHIDQIEAERDKLANDNEVLRQSNATLDRTLTRINKVMTDAADLIDNGNPEEAEQRLRAALDILNDPDPPITH